MILSAAQLRAARGLLDWTRSELAKASGLSPETIKNIEHGVYTPQEATIEAIIRTFASHDVEFTENEGVRKVRDVVESYVGAEEFRKFVDHFYDAVLAGPPMVCINGVNDKIFVEVLGEYAQTHFKRMSKIKGLTFRALAHEGDSFLPASSYVEYRWIQGLKYATVPFCVYGDRLAIIIYAENRPKVVVIKSKLVTQTYQDQFEVLWKMSKVPDYGQTIYTENKNHIDQE